MKSYYLFVCVLLTGLVVFTTAKGFDENNPKTDETLVESVDWTTPGPSPVSLKNKKYQKNIEKLENEMKSIKSECEKKIKKTEDRINKLLKKSSAQNERNK